MPSREVTEGTPQNDRQSNHREMTVELCQNDIRWNRTQWKVHLRDEGDPTINRPGTTWNRTADEEPSNQSADEPKDERNSIDWMPTTNPEAEYDPVDTDLEKWRHDLPKPTKVLHAILTLCFIEREPKDQI